MMLLTVCLPSLFIFLLCTTVATSQKAPPIEMDIGIAFTQCSPVVNTDQVVTQSTLLTQFQIELALQMAISEINNKSDLIHDSILPETVLKPHYLSFNASATLLDTLRMSQVLPTSGLSAAIGPDWEPLYKKMIPYYAENDIFSMGYNIISDASDLLSNFMQSNPAVEYEGILLASIAAHYQFHFIVVFYSSDFMENFISFWNFKNNAHQFDDMTIVKEIDISGLSEEELFRTVEECKHFNVYMFFMHSFEAVPLFETLYRASFFRNNLQLLGSSLVMAPDMWGANTTNLSSEDIAAIMTGFIALEKQCIPLETDFASRLHKFQLQEKHKQTTTSPSINRNTHCFDQFENVTGSVVSSSAVHAYNAVLAVAMGLHTLVTGPKGCQRVNISLEHDLFGSLNATSRGDSDLSADLLKQVIEVCTPYSGASISTSTFLLVDDTSTHTAMFSVLNFDPVKYLEDVNNMNSKEETSSDVASASAVQSNEMFCPATELPGMRVIGAVEAAAAAVHPSFISCEEYSRAEGVNLSVSCSETVIFNTEDNSVPSDHTCEQYDAMIDTYATVLYTFLAFGMMLTIFCGLVIYNNRNLRIVRIAQPEFAYVAMIGLLLNYSHGVLIVDHSLHCFLQQWVVSLSCTTILVPSVVSVWRMHVVLNVGVKRTKVTISYAMKVIFSVIGAKILLLIGYTMRGYYSGETLLKTRIDPSGGEYDYCHLQLSGERDLLFNFIGFLNSLFDVMFFCGGVYYAYSTKKTPLAANLAKRTLSGEK